MVTRTLTGVLKDGSDNPLAGVRIQFLLVNERGKASDGWDPIGERIGAGPWETTTDDEGEFSIDLWPTTRSMTLCYWKCTTVGIDTIPIVAPLYEGEAPLNWYEWKGGAIGELPEPLEIIYQSLDIRYRFNWRGSWTAELNCAAGDLVVYAGSCYRAKLPSLDIEPAVGDYWELVAQGGGVHWFGSKAAMDAALDYDEGEVAIVGNDATPANNGYYGKVGVSGAGSWSAGTYNPAAAITAEVDALWKKHSNVSIIPASGQIVTISSVAGTAITLAMGNSFFVGGDVTFKGVPALGSTTLTNTQCLYLNIGNLDAITWSAASAITGLKNDKTKLLAIVNFYGRAFSPIPSIQALLTAAETLYNNPSAPTTLEKLVATAGGDYATVTAAEAAITDATNLKRYRLNIKDGTYSPENGPDTAGLTLKGNVDIVGAGRGRVILRGPEAAAGAEHTKHTIAAVLGSCTVSGVTLHAYKNKYPVHIDGAYDLNLVFTLRDCDLQHFGGADGYDNDIGLGLYQNQRVIVEDCALLGNGLFVHGAANNRAANTSWSLTVRGTTGRAIDVQDFLEYTSNRVIIDGCRFDHLLWMESKAYFDANPGNALYNRGYYNASVELEVTGSWIGRIIYGTLFSPLADKRIVIPGMNCRAINKGAGTIAAGQAVKLLANPAAPNAYPSANQMTANVAAWDGSGIFYGFAEVEMVADATGCVQYANLPYALADASGAAIAYGDELEVNASGSLVKRTTGLLRAYAREAKASGTGQIEVLMV